MNCVHWHFNILLKPLTWLEYRILFLPIYTLGKIEAKNKKSRKFIWERKLCTWQGLSLYLEGVLSYSVWHPKSDRIRVIWFSSLKNAKQKIISDCARIGQSGVCLSLRIKNLTISYSTGAGDIELIMMMSFSFLFLINLCLQISTTPWKA